MHLLPLDGAEAEGQYTLTQVLRARSGAGERAIAARRRSRGRASQQTQEAEGQRVEYRLCPHARASLLSAHAPPTPRASPARWRP